jgi:hypothetical protein
LRRTTEQDRRNEAPRESRPARVDVIIALLTRPRAASAT